MVLDVVETTYKVFKDPVTGLDTDTYGNKQWNRNYLLIVMGSGLTFWVVTRAVVSRYMLRHKHYRNLSVDRRRRFDLFVLSTINAVSCFGFCAWKLVSRTHKYDAWGSYEAIASVGTYLAHDLWATRADWLAHPSDLIHHLLGLSITYGLIFRQPLAVIPLIPDYGLVEGSTIFLNIMWILRELGKGNSAAHGSISKLFALSFFLLRICWMPYRNYILETSLPEVTVNYPYLRWGLHGAAALQFWWFRLILYKFVAK